MTSPTKTSGPSTTPSPGTAATGPEDKGTTPAFVPVFEASAAAAVLCLTAVAASRGYEPRQVTDIGTVDAWVMLVAVGVMTLALLFMLRSVRGTRLIAALFALSLFTGFGALTSILLGAPVSVVLTSVAVIAYYRDPAVIAYDAIVVAGIAGIAAIAGPVFAPETVLIVMAVLAAYDVVAVYGTRHMVRLAKALLRRRVFFAMIVPETPRGAKTRLSAVGQGSGFVFLGTGDLALPALLVSSVTAIQGVSRAVPVIAGTLAGFLLLHFLFAKGGRRPMPALPPIAIGALLGYASSILFQ